MADILHCFPIRADAKSVYEIMTSAVGLESWWTQRSQGDPKLGEIYEFWFGPEYDWRGTVTRCEPGRAFEWTMTEAMDDWIGTRVGFELFESDGVTTVDFYHVGWAEASSHYRVSNCCWAMYLRVLRRKVEFGEFVPYSKRLDS